MTDKEKLEKIKRLADDMYYKMAHLTSDTRPIRKAMEDYHSFIVHEYNNDEQADKPIDFKQELYKAFGQVKDFTLGMQIAKRFYEMGKQHQEPVSIWHDASEKPNIKEKSGIFVITLLNGEYIGSRYYNYDDITINFGNYDKWAYLNDLVNLPNVERIGKDWKEEPVSEDFENALAEEWKGYNDRGAAKVDALEDNTQELAFAKGFYRGWHSKKEEPVSEDLGEYINELSKQFQEVSFAKLSRIAVRVVKWQKENLWKHADGDDLPEIDKEVIALFDDGKVVFAHRPPEYWDGKNIITGEVTRYYPKTYDKGGWNIPDVVLWLDLDIPQL